LIVSDASQHIFVDLGTKGKVPVYVSRRLYCPGSTQPVETNAQNITQRVLFLQSDVQASYTYFTTSHTHYEMIQPFCCTNEIHRDTHIHKSTLTRYHHVCFPQQLVWSNFRFILRLDLLCFLHTVIFKNISMSGRNFCNVVKARLNLYRHVLIALFCSQGRCPATT